MITNNDLILSDFTKKSFYHQNGNEVDFFNKTGTSDFEQGDSGYLTNYNHDTLSTNSSGMSSEDLYPQRKPSDDVIENKVYFCENAVFDEPKLEGPPILSEDISINLNKYLEEPTVVEATFEGNFGTTLDASETSSLSIEQSRLSVSTIIETSCTDPKYDDVYFDKLRLSTAKNEKPYRNDQTPVKPVKTPNDLGLSPDLFSDDEDLNVTPEIPVLSFETVSQSRPVVQNEQMLKNDRKLLRRVQEAISGVPPPPSVTILQITVAEMLGKIKANGDLFATGEERSDGKSLLVVNRKEEIEGAEWPEIVNYRYHGLQ